MKSELTNIKSQEEGGSMTMSTFQMSPQEALSRIKSNKNNLISNKPLSSPVHSNMNIQLFIIGDCLKGTSIIEISPHVTIKLLKKRIASKFKLNKRSMRMSKYNGKPLNIEQCTLMDYGINDQSTIDIRTVFSTCKISIQLNGGKFELNNLKYTDSIESIKKHIYELYGFPIEAQTLGPDFVINPSLSLLSSVSDFKHLLDNNIVSQNKQATVIRDKFWRNMRRIPSDKAMNQFHHIVDKVLLLNIFKIEHNHKTKTDIFAAIKSTKQNKTEHMLYHGTPIENVEKIIYNGFDRDYNKRYVYGRGTYFASSPLLAMKYCTASNIKGNMAMLVCRVLVGEYTKGFKHMSEQALYKPDGVTLYDSLVNNIHNPGIFVINRDYHAIPEYIIEFKININQL